MQAYHDEEWCRSNRNDQYNFELLTLEGAQAGLSWSIVLAKRTAYRWEHLKLAYREHYQLFENKPVPF